MAFLGLQARRFAQPFPDADNVVVARAKPLVGVFVCIAGLVERGADPFERRGEGYQLFVEFQSAGGDLLGVLVLIVVFPEVGHQLEQGEEVRRRGDDDFPVVGVRPDRRIVLQRGEECRFVGDEHDDEVGRVEPPLVLLAAQLGDVLAHRGHVRREVTAALLLAFGRGVADERCERNLRVDDDVLLFGQVQHYVGAQVAALLVLDVVLGLVMYAFDECRAVEDRFEQHLAPVALHLRVAFQRVGEVGRLGRDTAVQLHEVFQLGFQLAPLRGLRGVDLFDPLAEVGDVVAEGFQQTVDLLLTGLAEAHRVFAQNFGREVFELRPEGLLQLFALGLLGRTLLGVFRPQRREFRLGRGPERRQLRFGAGPLFGQCLCLRFVPLAKLPFGRHGLLGRGQPGFGGRKTGGGVAFARFGVGVRRAETAGFPMPEQQDDGEDGCQAAGCQYEKRGRGHGLCGNLFHAKIAIYSRKTSRSGRMRNILAPNANLFA